MISRTARVTGRRLLRPGALGRMSARDARGPHEVPVFSASHVLMSD